jgi:hypothetical protein
VQNNLTTLANVKTWAAVTVTTDDNLLNLLIGNVSRFILSYLQRPTLFQNACNDVYDGFGQRAQMLRNFPVLSVSSFAIDGNAIPAATGTPPSCGYILEPWDGFPPGRAQAIALRGYTFCRGYSNIAVTYTSGFVVQGEAQTVPGTPFQVTVNAPNGPWAVDQGVTYANGGAALTPVTGSPAVGQYSVSNGVYTFNSGDAGSAVLISYSYVPADIQQAAMEMVTERYKYKDRIGYISKSLGGQETVTFSQKNMPDFIRTLLQPYRRVVLV